MWTWLTGASSPAKLKEVLEAEQCFDATSELPAIRRAFKNVLKAQSLQFAAHHDLAGNQHQLPSGNLDKRAFLEGLCHLQGLDPVLGDALFHTVWRNHLSSVKFGRMAFI